MKLFLPFLLLLACGSKSINPPAAAEPPRYDSIPTARPVPGALTEASGLAPATDTGWLWTVEDSGHPAELILLKTDGTALRRLAVPGATNRDWEELVRYGQHLYIGDIGDNSAQWPYCTIYKVRENMTAIEKGTELRFRYPDGAQDSEAMWVDGDSIYIITKRSGTGRIYRIRDGDTALQTATLVTTLPYSGVVAAALSPDGRELIVKTYTALYQYYRKGRESMVAALARPGLRLPYTVEPQGEAVTFSSGGRGYYTLSEKGMFGEVKLFFYRKK